MLGVNGKAFNNKILINMTHTQKIVKIALLLQKKFDWNELQINSFINHVSQYTSNLREFNEMILNSPERGSFVEYRNLEISEAKSYIMDSGIENVVFSKNVCDCPIKMNLGKEFANYADNKSFVIDL